MADTRTGEYAGKSTSQTKTLQAYKEALGYSKDYVRQKFQTAVRMYRLFLGKMPSEIEGTFSQVMLWFPYAIIQREIAGSMRRMLEGASWLNLNANELKWEPTADVAKKWLLYQMNKVQQFTRTVIPSMQMSYIMGNGYRWYGHHYRTEERYEPTPMVGDMGVVEDVVDQAVKRQRGIITGQAVNFFNVYPSPNGGMINPPADTMEAGLDNLVVQMYMPESFIKAEVQKDNFDKAEAKKLFDMKSSNVEEDPATEYKHELLDTDGSWNQFTAPEWVNKMRSESGALSGRWRLGWFMRRDPDRWAIIAEDKYVLYDGPPLFNFWPLANFCHSPNGNEFFGFSLLETVEDLLISMILNFNMRMDYLAMKFFPPKWLPQQLIDDVGGDKSKFDFRPYDIRGYQHTRYPGGIGQYIHNDEFPPLDQQAFLEQGQMNEYLEEIISQHGAASQNASTATVGALLSAHDVAPKMLRAINNEMTGIKDSVEATLRLGAKYVNENQRIRTDAEGMPWEKIDHHAIVDGYGVEVDGARQLAQAEEVFKRQLSVAPMFLNNPNIRGQLELNRQLLEQAGYRNVDRIIFGDEKELPTAQAGQAQPAQMPGGVPSTQNDTRSTMNRNTVNGAGRGVAAMAAMV